MNNTVLMTTISVAYFTSPCASFAKIGRTANAGVAACTINFSLIKTITTTLDTEGQLTPV